MVFINLPVKSEVPLVAPASSCCNCGSSTNINAQPTDLRRMPLFGLAGAEIKITLPFPYCEHCAATARRKRPNALGVLAVSILLALALGMGWLFFGPQTSEETTTYLVAPALIFLSFCIVIGFYSLRKPKGSQTSYYQPIKLKNTGHRWPADITGLELAFTNAQYKTDFENANRPAIEAKKLKVSNA